MPDDYDDIVAAASGTPRVRQPRTSHLDDLLDFAKENKLTPGSTTGGTHNAGSKHYSGNAMDIKGSGAFNDTTVNTLKVKASERGLLLRDERVRPPRQKVWGGPHVHIEVPDDYQNPYDAVVQQAEGPSPRRQDSGTLPPDIAELAAVGRAAAPRQEVAQGGGQAESGQTEPTGAPAAPTTAKSSLSTNDASWHYGMTPEQAAHLTPRQYRVLAAAVEEDTRKKAAGQAIAPPSLRYQNEMRAKAGMKPLKFNMAAKRRLKIGTFEMDVPNSENAVSPYYRPETGTMPTMTADGQPLENRGGFMLSRANLAEQAARAGSLREAVSVEQRRRMIEDETRKREGEINSGVIDPDWEHGYFTKEAVAHHVDEQLRVEAAQQEAAKSNVGRTMESALDALEGTDFGGLSVANFGRGLTSAAGSTLKQIDTATRIFDPLLGRNDLLRRVGSEMEAGAAEQGRRTAPTSTFGQVKRGLEEGVGRATLEIPKLYAGGRLLSALDLPQALNLPLQGALSRADEGAPGIIKGAAGGFVYHYGGAVTGPYLSQAGNALLWIGAPAAEAHFVSGQPWAQAISENLAMGAYAGFGGGGERVRVKDTSRPEGYRNARLSDLPKIYSGKLDVVPPAQVKVNTNDQPIALPEEGTRSIAPERPESVAAQMDALVNRRGNRLAVLIPPGQAAPSKIPKGYRTTRTEAGVVVHPTEISPEDIHSIVKEGDAWQMLGHPNPDVPEATRVVVARAGRDAAGGIQTGDELMTSYVVPGREDAAIEEMRQQFAPYKPTFEVGGKETAEAVVNDRSGGQSEVTPVQTTGLEGGDNRDTSNAKMLTEAAQSQAFRDHGFSGLNVPTQRVVMTAVLDAIRDPQIRKDIVKFVPVSVVNDLLRAKSASDVSLHDENVLPDASVVDAHDAVSISVDSANAIVVTTARLIAEKDAGAAKVPSSPLERSATGGTVDVVHGENLTQEERGGKDNVVGRETQPVGAASDETGAADTEPTGWRPGMPRRQPAAVETENAPPVSEVIEPTKTVAPEANRRFANLSNQDIERYIENTRERGDARLAQMQTRPAKGTAAENRRALPRRIERGRARLESRINEAQAELDRRRSGADTIPSFDKWLENESGGRAGGVRPESLSPEERSALLARYDDQYYPKPHHSSFQRRKRTGEFAKGKVEAPQIDPVIPSGDETLDSARRAALDQGIEIVKTDEGLTVQKHSGEHIADVKTASEAAEVINLPPPKRIVKPRLTARQARLAKEAESKGGVKPEEVAHWRSQMAVEDVAQLDASQKFLSSAKVNRLLQQISDGRGTDETYRQLRASGKERGLNQESIDEHIRIAEAAIKESTLARDRKIPDEAVGAEEGSAAVEGRPLIPRPKRVTGERSFPKTAEASGFTGGTDRDYSVITDKDAIERAERRITRLGLDKAVAELLAIEEPTKHEGALGILLIQKLEKAGDLKGAVEVASDLSRKYTKAGQFVQSAAIITRLSPEGVLMAAQKQMRGGRELSAEVAEPLIAKAKVATQAEQRLAEIEKSRPDIFGPSGKILPYRVAKKAGDSKPKVTARQARVGKLQDRLAAMEQQARERLVNRPGVPTSGQAGATTIIPDIADYVIIGAAKLAQKGIDRAVWFSDMAKEIGVTGQTHEERKTLRALYRDSYKLYEEQRRQFRQESRERGAQKQVTAEFRDVRRAPVGPVTEPTQGPVKPLTLVEYHRVINERLDAQKAAQKSRREFDRAFRQLNRTATQRVTEGATGLRRANLLTAARTHIRNVTSNIAFQGSEAVSRPIAAIADMAAMRIKKTGVRTTVGFDLPAEAQAILKSVVTEGPRRAADIILGREVLPLEGYGKERESVQSKMQLGESDTGIRLLDGYINTVFRTLEAEDAVFKVYAFARELSDVAHSQARTERYTDRTINVKRRARELQANPTDAMLLEAAAYADYATFQNDNTASGGVRAIKSAVGPVGRWGIEQIAPFDRTSTNILYRTFEYSPLGFIAAAKKFRNIGNAKGTELSSLPTSRAQYRGVMDEITSAAFTRAEQKAFARTFGRASTGTTLAGLALILAAKGLLIGASDYDDDKSEYFRKRHQYGGGAMLKVPLTNQYIYIGDNPVGKAMGTVATMYEQMARKKKASETDEAYQWNRIKGLTKAVGRIALDQPLAQSMQDLPSSFDKIPESAGNYVGSMIPGSAALTHIGELTDSEARKTYGEGFTAQIKKVIPMPRRFGRQSLAVNTGVNRQERGGLSRRALRALDPFNTTTEGTGPTASRGAADASWPMSKELEKFNITASDPKKIIPGKYENFKAETDAEYDARRKAEVEAVKLELQRLEGMSYYKKLGKQDQEKELKAAIAAGRAAARENTPAAKRKAEAQP